MNQDPIKVLEERFWTPYRVVLALTYAASFITMFFVL
jgi:hypothetical protein